MEIMLWCMTKIPDFYYKPYFNDSLLFLMEFRLDGKDTIHKRIEQIDYIIGSGHHTNSHIIDINGYVFSGAHYLLYSKR